MIHIEDLQVRRHPLKKKLKKHGITIGMAAKYLDRSYPYVCSMLNGIYNMPLHIEEALQVLINQLEITEGARP
jgi:hypothetical protein